MLELEFEWDIRKESENIRLHGVYFDDAAEAFYDCHRMERRDDDSDGYEDRWQTLCSLPTGDVIFVVYTERGDAIRIISARVAEPYERRIYNGGNEIHGWQRTDP